MLKEVYRIPYKKKDHQLEELTSEQHTFILQMMEEYPDLSYKNIQYIIGCISWTLYSEYNHFHHGQELFLRPQLHPSIAMLVCEIFEKIKALQSADYVYNTENFSKETNRHEEILFLFGHPQFKHNEKFLKNIIDFPKNYKAHNHSKIREPTIDILDRISEGTIRHYQLNGVQDLTIEEQSFLGIFNLSLEEQKKFNLKPVMDKIQSLTNLIEEGASNSPEIYTVGQIIEAKDVFVKAVCNELATENKDRKRKVHFSDENRSTSSILDDKNNQEPFYKKRF